MFSNILLYSFPSLYPLHSISSSLTTSPNSVSANPPSQSIPGSHSAPAIVHNFPLENNSPTESQESIIKKLEKHLPTSSPSYPNFVMFSYAAHLLIKETEKMLSENQEGDEELDLEKLELMVLRTRQCLDKVVPDLKQFHYPKPK